MPNRPDFNDREVIDSQLGRLAPIIRALQSGYIGFRSLQTSIAMAVISMAVMLGVNWVLRHQGDVDDFVEAEDPEAGQQLANRLARRIPQLLNAPRQVLNPPALPQQPQQPRQPRLPDPRLPPDQQLRLPQFPQDPGTNVDGNEPNDPDSTGLVGPTDQNGDPLPDPDDPIDATTNANNQNPKNTMEELEDISKMLERVKLAFHAQQERGFAPIQDLRPTLQREQIHFEQPTRQEREEYMDWSNRGFRNTYKRDNNPLFKAALARDKRNLRMNTRTEFHDVIKSRDGLNSSAKKRMINESKRTYASNSAAERFNTHKIKRGVDGIDKMLKRLAVDHDPFKLHEAMIVTSETPRARMMDPYARVLTRSRYNK